MITHAIITLMGVGMDQFALLSYTDMLESTKTALTISHSSCITGFGDVRQIQAEEGSVSKTIIEYATNEVKRRCAEEQEEYYRYQYIYYIGFIPKKSAKPTEIYYSIKENKFIPTDELPDILLFIAYIHDEKTRYNYMGGMCHFYCDATTGEIIGYIHGI